MRLRCRDLHAQFVSNGVVKQVLKGISLETRTEEFLTVLGPSGCGKTTFLRILAGAIEPASGIFELIRTSQTERKTPLLIRQENALFPWMTAMENACFGLAMQGVPKVERMQLALPLFLRYGLEDSQDLYPSQLSVGMKQRVALIRGFLSHPPMLLMDEPFASLDPQTRSTLQQDLLELWETREHVGIVFVTHDVDEAILLSDRIVVLSDSPATIKAEFQVNLPRPRTDALALEPAFSGLKSEILASSARLQKVVRIA